MPGKRNDKVETGVDLRKGVLRIIPQYCTFHMWGNPGSVLVLSGCDNRNPTDWEAYRQQNFIPHSSGMSSQGGRDKRPLCGLFYKGPDPIQQGSPA